MNMEMSSHSTDNDIIVYFSVSPSDLEVFSGSVIHDSSNTPSH